MLVKREVYMDGKLIFHAFLATGKVNSLVTTLPYELLKKHFQRELFHLEKALIIGQKMADRLLDEFTELILQNEAMHDYFYPNYLLIEEVDFKTAEQLIHLQDDFELNSGMCFTERVNPIEFFHIQQQFTLAKKHILKTARDLTLDAFEAKYLIADASKFCFRSYQNDCGHLLEFDDEGMECALVLNSQYQLKMFVTA